MRTVLVAGATGFVGSATLRPLARAGWRCRALTRDLGRARSVSTPGVDWCVGDVDDEASIDDALQGCEGALYLVHGMAEGGDFREREIDAAHTFARCAARADLRRVVYLGGMAPAGAPSPHLRSRLDVGHVLRSGQVPTIELRASMIVGAGSLSWLIVRDLAARLPVMVLPSWLRSRTQPVYIDDVVAALVAALELPIEHSEAFDLPGPEILTGREILVRVARQLGLRPPRAIEVPVLTPRLSALWVRFVTRARWQVAREVVVGLTHDVIAHDASFWSRLGRDRLVPFDEAARRVLAAEQPRPPGPWGLVERALHVAHAAP